MQHKPLQVLFVFITLLALTFGAVGTTPAQAKPLAAPGDFLLSWGSNGTGDGQFGSPIGVAVDSAGNVYVVDLTNHCIQKFDSNGNFLLKWGSNGSGNGQFTWPYSVAVDNVGNVYVADTYNHRIQVFNSSGTYLSQWGSYGSGNGQFNTPTGLAVDGTGNVYVIDYGNNRVQVFNGSGTFLRQWGSLGGGDGQFNSPYGVGVDGGGNVYVADSGNNRIQVFDNSGNFLRKWGSPGGGNGQFNTPAGVAISSAGYVYVVDRENHRVQVFDSSGTYLSKWGSFGAGNAQFRYAWGVAVNNAENVYVADQNNYRIQKFEGYTAPVPHTVIFHANSGSGVMSNQAASTPTALTLNAFTYDGYTFMGWNTAMDGSGTAYADGATYDFAADLTLYAQWTANTYTVSFDAQGGTPTPASMVVTYDSPYGTLPVVSLTGYTFNGWYTASTGGTEITPATIVSNASNHTLYAQWTDATLPSVISITRADPNPTNAASVDFTVTFSEPVTGVDETDFTPAGTVTGAAVTGISGSGAAYTLTVSTGAGSGALALDLNASGTGIADLESNPISGGFTGGEAYTLARGPIPNPWIGGIDIQSNQPIVAVSRPHVGAEVASYIGVTSSSTVQFVPMLFKGAFGGGYNAALYIQNISASTTNLTMEFVDSLGTVVYTKNDSIGSNVIKGYWLPSEAGLPDGFVGGVKVTASQNILAVGRPHVNGQVMSYNGFGAGSTTAWLPMFFKNGFGNYNTAIYVQNVTGFDADLTIQFLNLDGTVACTDTDTLGANASKGYWSLSVACDTGSLPMGFVGGVKVTSTQPVLAVGRAHLGAQITTYNGFVGGANTAYVPMLFRKAFGGSYNAALYLQNVSGASGDVTIEYVDNAGAVAATQNVTLASGAISSLWMPTVAGLPDGFVGGARITATQAVIAVGRPHLGSEITAYNGTSAGSLNAYLPMLFKNAYGSYQAAFYIQNTTGNTANVNISFYDSAGALSCVKTISLAPNATQGFWMPTVTCAP